MIIARVTGHIVASAKTPYYRDYKILKVIPESWDGSPISNAAPIIALDLVDAGIGERVLICQEGRWARETLGHLDAPVRSMIVAIVDQISNSAAPPKLSWDNSAGFGYNLRVCADHPRVWTIIFQTIVDDLHGGSKRKALSVSVLR